MDNDIKIKLDNVTIYHAADGTITITTNKGGGCVTMGLLIATALVAVGGGVLTVMGVIQMFNPNAEVNVGGVIFGLFMSLMFGIFAYYLYKRMHAGQATKEISISPIINVVKIGDRVIPFNDIVDIATREAPIPLMEGMVAIQFGFALTNGDIVELGRKAMESGKTEKVEQFRTEVESLLKGAIKVN